MNTPENEGERLYNYILYVKRMKIKEYSKLTGISGQQLADFKKGRTISGNAYRKIAKLDKDADIVYLMTGERRNTDTLQKKMSITEIITQIASLMNRLTSLMKEHPTYLSPT